MCELVDFQKARLIAAMPENFKAAYQLDRKDDYYLHRFAPFCQMYAAFLLNQGSYTLYGDFVNEYNKIIEQDELYQYYKEVQNSSTYGFGVLNRNYEKMKLKDERIPIKDNEFEFESNLENELYQALKDYFGDELIVGKQEILGYGKSDLTIDDVVAIELKKSKALRKDVYQTFEYSFEEKIKVCCLIATEFDEKVLEISGKLKVDCYSYSFIYEDVTGYPIGFWIEKVSSSPGSRFDEILSDMDNAVHFTNYDPKFDLDSVYNKKFNELKSVIERTRLFTDENKKEILSYYEKVGYDVSKGLEHVLEQVEAKEATL